MRIVGIRSAEVCVSVARISFTWRSWFSFRRRRIIMPSFHQQGWANDVGVLMAITVKKCSLRILR